MLMTGLALGSDALCSFAWSAYIWPGPGSTEAMRLSRGKRQISISNEGSDPMTLQCQSIKTAARHEERPQHRKSIQPNIKSSPLRLFAVDYR